MRRGICSLICVLAFAAAGSTPASAAPTAQRELNDTHAKLEIDSFKVPPSPGQFKHFKTLCPAGYSAILGTLREIPPGISIGTSVASGPNGRYWIFELENSTNAPINILVQVRCVEDVVFKQATASVTVQPDTRTEVSASCPHGFRGVGRGERVSMPGPPADDDFDAFFRVYLDVLGIDDAEVGIFDAFEAFDYYLSITCIKPDSGDDKTAAAKPKLKTKTVTGSVDAPAFNFGQVELKCPRGYSPAKPSFGPLPDRVNGFIDVPGTKRSQPVRFLNASPDVQHLEAELLCIALT